MNTKEQLKKKILQKELQIKQMHLHLNSSELCQELYNSLIMEKAVLKKELADYVIQQGIDSIHELTFIPSAIKGWKDAQATSGGVDLGEIDPDTCESRLCKGLYITGELLDYDGPCGGYNLSNAWLTGLKAAHAI